MNDFRSSDTSIGQFLLLIAIHYHGNQLTTISEMVSNYLNIKVGAYNSGDGIGLKSFTKFCACLVDIFTSLSASIPDI